MHLQSLPPSKASRETPGFSLNANAAAISQLFAERHDGYLNFFNLFLTCFNAIPNCIQEDGIDCEKAQPWFGSSFQTEVKDFYYEKRSLEGSEKVQIRNSFYFLYDDLIVYFEAHTSTVRFLFRKTELAKVEGLIAEFCTFRKRKQKAPSRISLLINGVFGIETKAFSVAKPKLSIAHNYNDDFKGIHQIILKRLSTNNDKGLVLLYGKPGTGKTSYLRYLIASLKKEIIFLPPNMAGALTGPNLIAVLIKHPNSILVIEDAEHIVVDRDHDGHSPVSALLNIADGLLADCLRVQIICTFNTDISRIDPALLRKGRLIASYEFKELEVSKAQQVSTQLGYPTPVCRAMTLTEIYNKEEKDFSRNKEPQRIGFATAANNRQEI